MIDHLIFDTTDATSIADSHSVGAYLRASDGTLLTHTDVSGKKALDVRVAEGINVEVDLSHVDDSVKVGDGTDFLAINADGSINITDNGGSLTVDAIDLDIRDLDAAQDSVQSWLHDGAGTALTSTLVGADQALDVNVVAAFDAALSNTAIANAAEVLAVADTAQDVVASPLANRKYLYIYNFDNTKVFIGSTGVTAADGFPISPGALMELRAGTAVDIEFVGQAGKTPEIRTLELS